MDAYVDVQKVYRLQLFETRKAEGPLRSLLDAMERVVVPQPV